MQPSWIIAWNSEHEETLDLLLDVGGWSKVETKPYKSWEDIRYLMSSQERAKEEGQDYWVVVWSTCPGWQMIMDFSFEPRGYITYVNNFPALMIEISRSESGEELIYVLREGKILEVAPDEVTDILSRHSVPDSIWPSFEKNQPFLLKLKG